MKKVLAANRILVCLLSAILVLSALSVTALASGGGQVYITATVTSGGSGPYHYEDDITITYKVHNPTGQQLTSMTFTVGLTGLLDVSSSDPKDPVGGSMVNFVGEQYTYSNVGSGVSGDWDALTVSGKIKSGIDVGEHCSFPITIVNAYGSSSLGQPVSFVSSNPFEISLEHREQDHDFTGGAVTWKDGKPATCTEGNTKYTQCAKNNCTFKKEEYVDYGGHDWSYNWTGWEDEWRTTSPTDPGDAIKVTRTCSRSGQCGQKDVVGTVEIKKHITPAQCIHPGNVDYSSTYATFPGDDLQYKCESAPTNVEIPALGHDWDTSSVTWDWSAAHTNWDPDAPDTPPSASDVTVKVTCKNATPGTDDSDHKLSVKSIEKDGDVTNATCMAAGEAKFKATVKLSDGKGGPEQVQTSESETFTIPQKKHDYSGNEVTWDTWTPEHTVKAHLKCNLGEGGAGHTIDVDGVVETTTKGATCTTPGKVTYTATAKFPDNDTVYTNPQSDVAENTKLGHSYTITNVDWDANPKPTAESGYKYNTTVKVTLHCDNPEHGESDGAREVTISAPVGASGDGGYEAESTLPNCTTTGDMVYKAKVTLPGEPTENHWSGGGKEERTTEPKHFTYDALGHDWETREEAKAAGRGFIWDPVAGTEIEDGTTPKVKLVLKCKNPTCNEGFNSEPYKTFEDVTLTQTADSYKAPTCEKTGEVAYDVTYTLNGETYSENNTEYTLKNLGGHQWQDGAIQWSWGEKSGDTYPNVTATRVCANGTSCDFTDGKQTVTATVERKVEKQPTYLEDGEATYTATAKFKDTFNGEANVEKTNTKQPSEVIPKLTPPTPESNVPSGIPNEQDVKDALSAAASAAVTQALNSPTCPTGMEKELYDAIRTAGAGTEGTMSVSTKLTVDDKAKSPVDGRTYPTGAGQTLENYYDIQIKVTVTSASISGGGSQTSNITQIATPIQLSVAKPGSGGPIFYVARYHDGSWQKLPTTLSGGNLLFYSNLFSPYAVISSDSIADADVDPIPDQTYTGSAITPKVVVYINGDKANPLVAGTDYELEWSNNVNVGTATVTIKALAANTHGLDAASTKTVTFSIVAAPSGGSGSGGATSPNTGDEAPLALYAGMLTLCLAGLAGIAVRRRKNK